MRTFSLLLLGVVLAWMLLARHDASLSATSTTQEILRVPQDYPTIQAAIDTAPEGATIQIAPGTYTENLKITKSVKLEGSGTEQTFLQPVPSFRDRDNVNPIITVQIPENQEGSVELSRFTAQQLERLPNSFEIVWTLGVKVEGSAKAKFAVEQIIWHNLGAAIAFRHLHRLEVRDSLFQDNMSIFLKPASQDALRYPEAEEAIIMRNRFKDNYSGAYLMGRRLRVAENTVFSRNCMLCAGIFLALTEGGRGEVLDNTVAIAKTGLVITQTGREARWIIRDNWLLNNEINLLLNLIIDESKFSVPPRANLLVERNFVTGAALTGILIWFPDRVEGGAMRLWKNEIIGNRGFSPTRPSTTTTKEHGHGIIISAAISPQVLKEPLKLELSENTITDNLGWGIAINADPLGDECGKVEDGLVLPEIIGSDNRISFNEKGNLCPSGSFWPPGFHR